MTITLPELSLVVLVGPSGSGKSTFARKHFKATEVLSSDHCRGLVSDDENDQAATTGAFAVLHFIAAQRLTAGKLRSSTPPTSSPRRASRWWRWRGNTTACRWPSSSTCRRSCVRSGTVPVPTGTSARM